MRERQAVAVRVARPLLGDGQDGALQAQPGDQRALVLAVQELPDNRPQRFLPETAPSIVTFFGGVRHISRGGAECRELPGLCRYDFMKVAR